MVCEIMLHDMQCVLGKIIIIIVPELGLWVDAVTNSS